MQNSYSRRERSRCFKVEQSEFPGPESDSSLRFRKPDGDRLNYSGWKIYFLSLLLALPVFARAGNKEQGSKRKSRRPSRQKRTREARRQHKEPSNTRSCEACPGGMQQARDQQRDADSRIDAAT